jgi:hypothetical protein
VRILVVALLISLTALAQTEPFAKLAAGKSGIHKPKPSSAVDATPPVPVSIPSMTPEELPALAPHVTYSAGQLTIDATNARLVDILSAIQAKTGAIIETPPGDTGERVAVHLSGRPRLVIPSLLDGSAFGYVIRAFPDDPEGVREVILSRRPSSGAQPGQQLPSAMSQPATVVPPSAQLPRQTFSANEVAGNTVNRNESAQPIGAMDEPGQDEEKPEPAPPLNQLALSAAMEDPHPAPPLQLATNPLNTDQAQQQQDVNRQFMQDLYRSRQKLQQPQPEPPPQPNPHP